MRRAREGAAAREDAAVDDARTRTGRETDAMVATGPRAEALEPPARPGAADEPDPVDAAGVEPAPSGTGTEPDPVDADTEPDPVDAGTEPDSLDAGAESASTEVEAEEPVAAEPAKAEAAPQPAIAEPAGLAPSEPDRADPAPAGSNEPEASMRPAPAGPEAAGLAPTDPPAGPAPAPAEPAPAGLAPADPPAEPAPTEPPAQPAPTEPAPAEPGRTGAPADAATPGSAPADRPASAVAETRAVPAALSWVSADAVAARSADAMFSTAPHRVAAGDLLPARRGATAALVAPLVTAGALALAYTATCLLWPLSAVAPEVTARTVESAPGPALSIIWPAEGTAAVAPLGLLDQTVTDSAEAVSMASITKLATVLMILEKLPLAPGEQGPSYTFTWDDYQDYLYNYLWTGQSSLDVPVDGTLTQYQMLEGILLGSANNYADRMMREVWGSQEAFAADAAAWLERNGFTDTTIVGPSGIERENRSTSAEVLRLSQLALENPVVAEIVAKKETTLPGNDEPVTNSNPLINDEGVVGVKTGTFLDSYNLVTAKQVDLGDDTITVVSAVLGQPDAETREAVSRQLIAAAEAGLQPATAVDADTVVASVSTEWGASADVVAADAATLSLWNGAVAATNADLDDVLGKAQGERVGTLTVTGTFDTQEIALELTDDLAAPSLWWRLTHPLDLLGLR